MAPLRTRAAPVAGDGELDKSGAVGRGEVPEAGRAAGGGVAVGGDGGGEWGGEGEQAKKVTSAVAELAFTRRSG